LELISPSEIEKALKKLRTINETKPSKALANPSVIFSHCIDEVFHPREYVFVRGFRIFADLVLTSEKEFGSRILRIFNQKTKN